MATWKKLSEQDLPGPPKFPPTEMVPPENFREGPAGNPDHIPNPGGWTETGYGPDEVHEHVGNDA